MKTIAALVTVAIVFCLAATGCGYHDHYRYRSEARQFRDDFRHAGWEAREEMRRARRDAQRELRQAREDFRREMRAAHREFHDEFGR
jgi:predicted phage gp36 major capsid-like protein